VTAPIRIGNASGFYGDRFSAMHEMLTGGPLDVLTGDYLAELTMLILGRNRLADPSLGYAKTFLRQLESSLGEALDRGVALVVNAGGVNPAGLADAIHELAGRLGLAPAVGWVAGDDLLSRAAELELGEPLAAHAYLGGWGIAACLAGGANLVVTGRVTDASLVLGPAAAHFGWQRTDFDALAGAVVAGHVIECGPQATGGNYSLFTELDLDGSPLGFPIAEVAADGSSVITKHPGTGGAVTVGTVTAQLLYEVTGPRYAGPDVTTRLDSVRLEQAGPDRVRISGVQGEPPPPTYKVSLNFLGGFRNEVEFVLTGLDLPAKAALVRQQFDAGPDAEWTFARTDHPDADTEEAASALLRCVVRGEDPKALGRPFSSRAVELALASYPGFHLTAPPGQAQPYGVFRAGYVPGHEVEHRATMPDGSVILIAPCPVSQPLDVPLPTPASAAAADRPLPRTGLADPGRPVADEGRVRVPLGALAGARSGDKGGTANIGLWARSDEAWRWLESELSVDLLRTLLPETAALPITRHLLPGLQAVNFVVDGLLGEGVAYQARFDPQAKALGEWLRSRLVDVPAGCIPTSRDQRSHPPAPRTATGTQPEPSAAGPR
jgi:hypothetical protein